MMKTFLKIAAALLATSASAGEKQQLLTTDVEFAKAASAISKQMAMCYETSIVGVAYKVYDDIDVEAKTGTVVYRQAGIGGKVTIAVIELNGSSITLTKKAAIINLKKLRANVESWLAGSKECK
jgi:hypothetical protein